MDIIIQFLSQHSNLDPALLLLSLIVLFSAFIKISTVFYILRLGLGFTGVPSVLVLSSLSISLTLFVMYPTIEKISKELNSSLGSQKIEDLSKEQKLDLYQNVSSQWLNFMRSNTDARHIDRNQTTAGTDNTWRVILPAFVISEITKAFKLGLVLFLPLLLVDLLVGTILTALDVTSVKLSLISLPLKLLLFLSVDGWAIISANLIKSYTA